MLLDATRIVFSLLELVCLLVSPGFLGSCLGGSRPGNAAATRWKSCGGEGEGGRKKTEMLTGGVVILMC